MKKIKFFLAIMIIMSLFCTCTTNSNVGKFCKPIGNTPCPATRTIPILDELIDAAKRGDNAATMQMMMKGDVLMLDVTISYKILEEGNYWFGIEADGKKLYVANHMVKVE